MEGGQPSHRRGNAVSDSARHVATICDFLHLLVSQHVRLQAHVTSHTYCEHCERTQKHVCAYAVCLDAFVWLNACTHNSVILWHAVTWCGFPPGLSVSGIVHIHGSSWIHHLVFHQDYLYRPVIHDSGIK